MSSPPDRPSPRPAASRDSAELRRELARARVRQRGARSTPPPTGALTRREREARIRLMLSDPHSRNP